MLREDEFVCSKCGGDMKHYDFVRRKTKTKTGDKWIFMERRKCRSCGSTQRVCSNDILPYKQYRAEIVDGVKDGSITKNDPDYYGYPCILTMHNWKHELPPTSLSEKSTS